MSYLDNSDVETHLKAIGPDENYDRRLCAVSGCSRPLSVIDATCRLAPCDVPLCEEHWLARCAATEVGQGVFTACAS